LSGSKGATIAQEFELCPCGREKKESSAVDFGAVPSVTSKFASTRSGAERAIRS
jgi:hypothetical protein